MIDDDETVDLDHASEEDDPGATEAVSKPSIESAIREELLNNICSEERSVADRVYALHSYVRMIEELVRSATSELIPAIIAQCTPEADPEEIRVLYKDLIDVDFIRRIIPGSQQHALRKRIEEMTQLQLARKGINDPNSLEQETLLSSIQYFFQKKQHNDLSDEESKLLVRLTQILFERASS